MLEFTRATTADDYRTIAYLADLIWREHYTPIIGIGQVNYMLQQFQSEAAIEQQSDAGMHYYLIEKNETKIGYLAFTEEGDSLFLSKIYLVKTQRGKGYGGMAMDFVTRKAKELGCMRIRLTVNKNNEASITAYKRIGFTTFSEVVKDIGEGYVMDDYVMEKPL